MGQYYMAYVRNDEGEKVFCPQDMGSGLKLMEHSWIGNDFVNGVLEAIWDSPSRVAWVGDYADDESDFHERYTKQVYEAVWGEDKEPERTFFRIPKIHKTGFIFNHDRRQYIDLERYAKAAAFCPSWDKGATWVTHPLPLLTAIGNGRGGGDYSGTNEKMVGSWAMDLLSFTEERPSGMDEVLIPFIEV